MPWASYTVGNKHGYEDVHTVEPKDEINFPISAQDQPPDSSSSCPGSCGLQLVLCGHLHCGLELAWPLNFSSFRGRLIRVSSFLGLLTSLPTCLFSMLHGKPLSTDWTHSTHLPLRSRAPSASTPPVWATMNLPCLYRAGAATLPWADPAGHGPVSEFLLPGHSQLAYQWSIFYASHGPSESLVLSAYYTESHAMWLIFILFWLSLNEWLS